MMLMMACLHTFCIFIRVAAFSISLVNDKTETVVPALDSMFMKSIVDVAIYKENTLKVTIFLEHIVITLRVSKIKVSTQWPEENPIQTFRLRYLFYPV